MPLNTTLDNNLAMVAEKYIRETIRVRRLELAGCGGGGGGAAMKDRGLWCSALRELRAYTDLSTC